jgi:hypothetical protein
VCAARKGCTGFEFAFAKVHRFCGTYTGTHKKIVRRKKQHEKWHSCLVVDTTAEKPEMLSDDSDDMFIAMDSLSSVTTTTAAPTTTTTAAPICPTGFYAIKYDLDGRSGVDKQWQPLDASRTMQGCADLCTARTGCTGFEFFSGAGTFKGFCGTYTGGAANVNVGKASAHAWYSCVTSGVSDSSWLLTNRQVAVEQSAENSETILAVAETIENMNTSNLDSTEEDGESRSGPVVASSAEMTLASSLGAILLAILLC